MSKKQEHTREDTSAHFDRSDVGDVFRCQDLTIQFVATALTKNKQDSSNSKMMELCNAIDHTTSHDDTSWII
eukprot:scaffold248297_cov96-Cyclotella_meneghiniana.AAC.2